MTTTDAERDDQLLLLASATEAAVQDTDRRHPEFPYVNILHANLCSAEFPSDDRRFADPKYWDFTYMGPEYMDLQDS